MKDFKDLLMRYCKANPDFFMEPWFEFEIEDKKRLITHVSKKRVNWRGKEEHEYDIHLSDDECCKQLLLGMMRNKSFLDYFKLVKYDSLEELDVKLAILGF